MKEKTVSNKELGLVGEILYDTRKLIHNILGLYNGAMNLEYLRNSYYPNPFVHDIDMFEITLEPSKLDFGVKRINNNDNRDN